MRRIVLLSAAVLVVGVVAFYRTHGDSPSPGAAQFTSDGKLVRPEGYRRWIYVSTGFGMSYSPEEHNHAPKFTNGFVNPSSYDYFVANGKWPDKTIFVLEEYDSSSKGSINLRGSYQQSLAGLVAEVKDESRFKQKWAYFTFSPTSKSAEAVSPAKNGCWQCHEDHAAVEHSFVQFYPELLKIAKEKKTLKPSLKLD